VSDVTGLAQVIPTHTVGASFGVAFLAAQLVSDAQIDVWNPAAEIRLPAPEHRELYDDLYQLYLSLYTQTLEISHALARLQSESHIDAPRPKESKE
jgi:xylulokinase